MAMPLAVGATGTAVGVFRRVRERLHAKRGSPERLLAEALRAADSAAKAGLTGEAATACERSLFLAIEAGTGLKARALMQSELARELEAAGAAKETIETTLEVFAACEALRFQGQAGGASPDALVTRTRKAAQTLARLKRPKA